MLVVDDDVHTRLVIRRGLEAAGYVVDEADTCAAAEEAARRTAPDVAILDYELPDGNALTLLPRVRAIDSGLPVVVLTGHASIDLAVRAMQEGADHFLTKPAEMGPLRIIVTRLVEQRRSQRRQAARQVEHARATIDPFASTSPAIRRLAEQARRVAASDSAVLVLGETGTGKGVLARWIHEQGPRAAEPFVAINCGGLTRELLEAELFGHTKGAFTGAVAAKTGLLEVAQHGTAFLDEIGDVDPAVQPSLLKALEDKHIRRLGDTADRPVDFRLIAATHQDLATLVRDSRFRSDLYFRISTVPLTVPPLRERASDIPTLVDHVLQRLGPELGRGTVRVTSEAMTALTTYAWPGNIRELRNVLERALLLTDGPLLHAPELHFDATASAVPRQARPAVGDVATLRDVERRHIEAVLRLEGGRVADAAKRLGIPRSSLYQKIRIFGIVVSKV